MSWGLIQADLSEVIEKLKAGFVLEAEVLLWRLKDRLPQKGNTDDAGHYSSERSDTAGI